MLRRRRASQGAFPSAFRAYDSRNDMARAARPCPLGQGVAGQARRWGGATLFAFAVPLGQHNVAALSVAAERAASGASKQGNADGPRCFRMIGANGIRIGPQSTGEGRSSYWRMGFPEIWYSWARISWRYRVASAWVHCVRHQMCAAMAGSVSRQCGRGLRHQSFTLILPA